METQKNGKRPIARYTDERGTLSVIEGRRDVPFAIKRVFFIANVPAGTTRGNHAYRHREFLVCLQGKCSISIDDGKTESVFTLDGPETGLPVPENTWRTLFGFSPDCILAVLSDALYAPEDYCTDHERFRAQPDF